MEENLLSILQDTIRNINNFNRVSFIISNRYYNSPPVGGYELNEEYDYIFPDNDDISSLVF